MHYLLLFFLLAYIISWTIWFPLYSHIFGIKDLPLLPYHHAWGAAGPLIAAFVVSSLENKKQLKDLIDRFFKWQVNIKWYLLALLSPFVLFLLGLIPYYIITQTFVDISDLFISKEFPNFSFLTIFLYNFCTFGLGEETGWRGYALPKLETRFNNLKSTIILTFFWAGWHIPLFLYRPGYTGMDMFGIFGWIMSLFTGAVLLTWLFQKANGSILIASIFHATIDIVFTSKASDSEMMNYIGALITIWGILTLVSLSRQKTNSI